MAIEHSQSRLLLKNMTPILPEGMLLFPLDGNIGDTRQEIPVSISSSLSTSYDRYKYHASTAVEVGTTNLVTIDDSRWYLNKSNYQGTSLITTGRNPFSFSSRFDFKPKLDPGTSGWQVAQYTHGVPFVVGTTYTWSIHIKRISSDNVTIRLLDGNGLNQQGGLITVDSSNSKVGEWVRFSHTWTPSVVTGGVTFYIGSGENSSFEVADPQIEAKNYETSFIKGIRDVGQLKYDLSALNMRDAGCISCWIYTSPNMINMYNANNQYLLKLGSMKYSDWTDDAVYLSIQSNAPRRFGFGTLSTTASSVYTSDYTRCGFDIAGVPTGSWNHFVIQWDKNGLPTGAKKELYINGKLEASNLTESLPNNFLTYLHVGSWHDGDTILKPSTFFEHLAVHPSKGFSPEEIKIWHMANAPFFDIQDSVWNY